MDGLGAATQDAGIARFQAETGRFYRHVRARFIDDADNTQRHTHFANLNTGGQKLHVTQRANRIVQGCNLTQTLDHGGQAGRRERQAIQHSIVQAIVTAGLQVQLVSRNQLLGGRFDGLGSRQQGSILDGGWGTGNHARGLTGLLPQRRHVYHYLFRTHAISCHRLTKCGIIAGSPMA